MNLIDTIKNQLFSDGHLNQLSSLIGADAGATKSAVGAAMPAVVAALSNVASKGNGAQKVVSALNRLDTGSLGNVAHMLSGQAESVQEQGSSLLSSLLGGSTVSGIANAVSKFSGIGPGAVQKLLGYLMPMILGGIAGRFAGKQATAQGLTSMLAEQKSAIANALPSGDRAVALGQTATPLRSACPCFVPRSHSITSGGLLKAGLKDTSRPSSRKATAWTALP